MKLIINEWFPTGWKIKKQRELADKFGRPGLEACIFIARRYNSIKLADSQRTKSAALFAISYNEESFLMHGNSDEDGVWEFMVESPTVAGENPTCFDNKELGHFIQEAILADS